MHHLQCHIHFTKNVADKMKYKMKAVTKHQQKEVMLLLHRDKAVGRLGLTDMSVELINEFLPQIKVIM